MFFLSSIYRLRFQATQEVEVTARFFYTVVSPVAIIHVKHDFDKNAILNEDIHVYYTPHCYR